MARLTRSGCPVSAALEVLGDKWSFLIIRDLMVRGLSTFKEFSCSGERIASNILSARLRKLKESGIVGLETSEADRRVVHYRLTEKGMALAPALLELLIWGARHERSSAPGEFIDSLEANRRQVLAEARTRWEKRDRTPLIPPFSGSRERKLRL